MVRGWFQNNVSQPTFDIHMMPIGQTDITRLRKGKLGGQFWSAFVPWLVYPHTSAARRGERRELIPMAYSPRDGESSGSTLLSTLQQIDVLHAIFEHYPHVFGFVTHSSEILPTFRAGKVVSLLSIEGLHQIVGSPSVLRMLWRLGVRLATLCHNKGNEYADSAVSPLLAEIQLTCSNRF